MKRRFIIAMILFYGCASITGCLLDTGGLHSGGYLEPGLPGLYIMEDDPLSGIDIRQFGDSRMVYGWGWDLGMPSWGFVGNIETSGDLRINLGERAEIVWSDPETSTIGAGARQAQILYTPGPRVEIITFRISEAGSRVYTLVRTSD